MDDIHLETVKSILERNIVYLRENLMYFVLKAPLLSADVISIEVQNKIESIKEDRDRSGYLILYLICKANEKINVFLDILLDETYGHKFVYEYLDKELRDCYERMHFPVRRPTDTNRRQRQRNVIYRHTLMRLSHNNQIAKFNELKAWGIAKWTENIHLISDGERKKRADLYAMAIDSEIGNKRIKSDESIYHSGVLCDMEKIMDSTSDPTRTTMLFLARKGSSMKLAGFSYEEAMSYVEQAVQQTANVAPCRETGMVFYIQFNMMANEYEKRPTKEVKTTLLQIAQKAVDHFETENEQTGCDYRRFILIKMAMIYLGIGLFGESLCNIEISSEDLRSSENCLKTIKKPEMWKRMEIRRKMFYNMSQSKLLQLLNDMQGSLKYIKRAKKHAIKGGFEREGVHIDETMTKMEKEMTVVLC